MHTRVITLEASPAMLDDATHHLRKPLTQAVGLLARKPQCVGHKQRWSWSAYEF
jgi:hypothetical protein